MTLTQISRDDAVRTLGLWLLATAVHASVLTTLTFWYLADRGPSETPLPALSMGLLLGWFLLAPYLAFGRTHRRCSELELVLPLAAGRLWLRHVAAVVLGGTLILALAGAVVGLWMANVEVGRRFAADLAAGRLAASLGLGLVLAVLILEGAQPSRHRASRSRGGYGLRLVAAVAGVPALLLGLSLLPFGWTLAVAAMTLGLGWLTWRSLPPAFALASAAVAEAPPRRGAWAGASASRGGRLPLLIRLAAGPPLWRTFFSLLVFGVLFLSGLASAVTGNDALRLLFTPLVAAALLTAVAPWLAQVPCYDPLPISRRILFAVMVAAVLGSVAANYGIGRWATVAVERREARIQLLGRGQHLRLRLPLEYLEIARDGRPPEITTPWGETFTPPAHKPFAGSPAVLYSPFSLPRASSPEFVALQLAGAVEAVYGHRMAPREIRQRYLEVTDGGVRFRGGRFALLDDHPGLRPRPEGPLLPAVLVLVGVPWLILLALVLPAFRSGWSQARYRKLSVVLTVAVGLALAADSLIGHQVLDLTAGIGLLEVFLRRLGASTAGTLAVWGVSAALLAAAYLLAEAAFRRAELPAVWR